MTDREEKGLGGVNTNNTGNSLPTYEKEPDARHHEGVASTPKEEAWATRNGLSVQSFQKRDYGRGIIELDRSMKSRHLHMIAIGETVPSSPASSPTGSADAGLQADRSVLASSSARAVPWPRV